VGPAWYVAGAWLAAALLAQATLAHYLAIRGVVPSFVMAVVVWYAVRVDPRRAAVSGLASGLCEDALSLQTGAAWMVSTGVSAMLASLLSRGFFADSIPLVMATAVVATLVRALAFWIMMALFGYPPGLGPIHFHEAVVQSGLTVAVVVVAMLIARRLDVARQ
jgi:rod shape-determining protein MreD